MAALRDEIEAYVSHALAGWVPPAYRVGKLIRDPLHGCVFFEPAHVSVLDCPLVQRLRKIHQTSLAVFTYPSAAHSRFDHTLGVAHNAAQLIAAIQRKHPELIDGERPLEIIIAGILHDCGHGPFSHSSEELIKEYPEIRDSLRLDERFSNCQDKPHEALSYLIATSASFRPVLDRLADEYGLNRERISAHVIGNMIVGKMDVPDQEGYLSDIINGTFDADKLDYMSRDSYFTGLRMVVDIDRILYTMGVRTGTNRPRRLCTDLSGVPNLEQMLFNKMLLFSSMYHHHKVRTANCMLKTIFEIIRDGGSRYKIAGRDFSRAVDFLYVTDEDVLTPVGKRGYLRSYIERINRRELFKRALVISKRTVKTHDFRYTELTAAHTDPGRLRRLRETIAKRAHCPVYEVLVDMPEGPSFREASQMFIRMPSGPELPLSKVFATDWWMNAYAEVKWQGHVFCPADLCRKVGPIAKRVLEEEFDVEVLPGAIDECSKPDVAS